MNDLDAKQIVDTIGLTPAESLYLRMVAKFETDYGDGWGKGLSTAGQGSNNWGAITVSCDSGSPMFEHEDSRYEGNSVIVYSTCFKAYPTPLDGANDLARVLLKQNVKNALAKGDIRGAVVAQYQNHYFMGISNAPGQKERDKENIDTYYNALQARKEKILANTGEKNPFKSSGKSSWMVLSAFGAAAGLGMLLLRR